MKVWKPTKEQMQPAIAELKLPMGPWAVKYLETLQGYLTANPIFYRAFGPYWWLVKKALVDASFFEFGEVYDADWFEALDYGENGMNLLVAHHYYDEHFGIGPTEQQHVLDGEGEAVDYWLEDPDMEIRVKAKMQEAA